MHKTAQILSKQHKYSRNRENSRETARMLDFCRERSNLGATIPFWPRTATFLHDDGVGLYPLHPCVWRTVRSRLTSRSLCAKMWAHSNDARFPPLAAGEAAGDRGIPGVASTSDLGRRPLPVRTTEPCAMRLLIAWPYNSHIVYQCLVAIRNTSHGSSYGCWSARRSVGIPTEPPRARRYRV